MTRFVDNDNRYAPYAAQRRHARGALQRRCFTRGDINAAVMKSENMLQQAAAMPPGAATRAYATLRAVRVIEIVIFFDFLRRHAYATPIHMSFATLMRMPLR